MKCLTFLRAIKIIAERAVRGRTYEFLLRHIMGKNEEKRDKALTTLCFLHERGRMAEWAGAGPVCCLPPPKVDDQVLKPTFAIFKAVIKCLCTSKMNREAEHFEKVIKTGACFYRSQHYNDALRLLRRIVLDSENGLREALRAGLVTDWLMHYPWQVAAADDSPKEVQPLLSALIDHQIADPRQAIKARMQWPHPDATMSWILRELAKNKKRFPSDQIEDFGLFDQPSFDSGAATTTMNPSVFLEDMSLEEEWMAMNEGSRTHEESEEEAMLRRRRREAVIIQEDGQPPGSADIIQRLTTDLPGSPADSAQELELLQQRRDEINLAALQRITQSTG